MCVCTSQNMYVADTFVLNRSVTKLITIIRSVRSGLFIRQSRSGFILFYASPCTPIIGTQKLAATIKKSETPRGWMEMGETWKGAEPSSNLIQLGGPLSAHGPLVAGSPLLFFCFYCETGETKFAPFRDINH